MADIWDQARIEQYIAQGIEESLTFDYKAAGSLAKADDKKAEITKDVSAMANSAGGLIIYGVAEYQDKPHKHLPEKITPIDRTQFPKEWLEQVISNIRPKIDGLVIHPVALDTAPNHAVYVVEIPQSHTAHQATDKRYYKRFNFESVAMEDYEIRDVMGRRQYPHIELEVEIEITQEKRRSSQHTFSGLYPTSDILGHSDEPESVEFIEQVTLKIWARNSGRVYAEYVDIFVNIPDVLLPVPSKDSPWVEKRETIVKDGELYYEYFEDNTTRDVVDIDVYPFGSVPKYGPARHTPILPSRSHSLSDIDLRNDFKNIELDGLFIEWETSADNAPPLTGRIAVAEIEVVDVRGKTE